MKKLLAVLIIFSIILSGCNATTQSSTEAATADVTTGESLITETSELPIAVEENAIYTGVVINIDDNVITVDGSPISSSEGAVYLAKKTETHPNVSKEIENSVLTITAPGRYTLSGSAENTQVVVKIAEDNTEETSIVLAGLNLSCATAPAILFESAYETAVEGTGSVTLELAADSNNVINGSHTVKDEANGVDYKNDAAISSNISFIIEGEGTLEVNADKEGIESKMHLTINGGNITVNSADDALNASEDGISHITINDGTIIANSTIGSEGDGIDSNGYIAINGGIIFAFANENSMDSGLDSDLGTTINGGIVLATGNMYDEIKGDGAGEYVALRFAERISERITMVDSDNRAVFSFMPQYAYTVLCFSAPELEKASFSLYKGGSATGEELNGLILSPTDYSSETLVEARIVQAP